MEAGLADAAAASSEGRPSDVTSEVPVPSTPSDTAGVETLLDLTDDAANSLDPEPKQRRIRIRLRRPNERRRHRTEATTDSPSVATTTVTNASVQESADDFTVAPVEATTEVSEERFVDGADQGVKEVQTDATKDDETNTNDKDERRIRVIRIKRPRERTTVPPTKSTSELQENEVTVDGLDDAKTTVQSDVEEASVVHTTELGSERSEPNPEDLPRSSKVENVAPRERSSALLGNAVQFEEGIRGSALEDRFDPGHVGEPDFTVRNTLRRLGSRRRVLARARSSQSVEEEEEKQVRGALQSRPRIGFRRQRLRPTSGEAVLSATVSDDRQNSVGDEAKERPPLRGIRRINLRARGPVLRGRSRDGLASARPSATTQVVTDVQATTESSAIVSLTDVTSEQPRVNKVTVTESVTVVSEFASPASPAEDTTEALKPAQKTESTAATSDEEVASLEKKQTNGSVRRPLRRGLIRRLPPVESGDPEGPATGDEDSEVVGRDRTQRRLRNGNGRNTLRAGTIRRRLRQRGGLRRIRPGRPEIRPTTEKAGAGVGEVADKVESDLRETIAKSLSEEAGVETTITTVPTERSSEPSKADAKEGDLITELDLLNVVSGTTTTPVYEKKEAATISNDEIDEQITTEAARSKEDAITEPVISITNETDDIDVNNNTVSTEQEGIVLSEDEQSPIEDGNSPISAPPVYQEQVSPVLTPTVSAQDPTNATAEDEWVSTTAASIADEEIINAPRVGEATPPGRRPPVLGVVQLHEEEEEVPADEPDADQASVPRRNRPRNGLRNRLRSQQRTEVRSSSPEKEIESDQPTVTREGLLSQLSPSLDAERTREEEQVIESGSIAREGLLRRVRPTSNREVVLEQLTGSDEIKPSRVQGGILRLRRPTNEEENETEIAVAPGRDKAQNETGAETADEAQKTTKVLTRLSVKVVANNNTTPSESPVEQAEDIAYPVLQESTEDIEVTLQGVTTELSTIASTTPVHEDKIVTEISVASESPETTTSAKVGSTTETTSPTRRLISRIRERQGSTSTAGRNSLSIADRLALLRTSLGNRNASPSPTPPTNPSTTFSTNASSAFSTTERVEETAVDRLQRLRQSLLTGQRERPDPLAALRRRTSSLAAGRRPLQRTTVLQRPTVLSSGDITREATGAVTSSADATSSSLATEATTTPETETEAKPSIQKPSEEAELDDAAGKDVPSRSRDAPFRRTFVGPRQRPFPIRPSSHRRGSLGSRLRERLSAAAGVPTSPEAEKGKDETEAGVLSDTDTSVTSAASPLLPSREGNAASLKKSEENKNDIAESGTPAPGRPLFQPPRRSPALAGIAERLKERLSRRPGFVSRNQETTAPSDITSTQPPTVTTESSVTASSEVEDTTASPSLGQFGRSRRPVVVGGLRNSLRQRLVNLSSRRNVEASAIPNPDSNDGGVSDIPANDVVDAGSPTGTSKQTLEDTTTERQEVTTEAPEHGPSTAASSDQDLSSFTTSSSGVVLEQQVGVSAESITPSHNEGLQDAFIAQLAGDFDEAGEPLIDGSSDSSGVDVEYTASTTTERTIPTRRSALLRFSSRNKKPVFKETIPGSVQNERANSDLAAKLASKPNTESPLSALRKRLRASLAASIGLGSSSGLKTQGSNVSSDRRDDSGVTATSNASSVVPLPTESHAELSTTKSPKELTAVPQEHSTSSSLQVSGLIDSTDSDISDLDGTTISDLSEKDTNATTEHEIQDIKFNTSRQEITHQVSPTTDATTVTTSTTTTSPRKLSLVQQLRQRQEQKKSSVKSLVEQLRSSLVRGQKAPEKMITTTTTTTSRTTTETASEETTDAVQEATARENGETTTLSPSETSAISSVVSEPKHLEAATLSSDVVTTTVASVDGTENKIGSSTETPIQQLQTTRQFAVDGVVHAVAVDPAALFSSATESSSEVSSLPPTTESLPSIDMFSEEAVVYASTPADTDASDTENETKQSEAPTVRSNADSTEENQSTSAQSSSDKIDVTEDRSNSDSTEPFIASNRTSTARVIVDEQHTQEVNSNVSEVVQLSPGANTETTTLSQLAEGDTIPFSSTTILPDVIPNDLYEQESEDEVEPYTVQPYADNEGTTLPTRGREGRLLQFEEAASVTAQPFTPPTTAPGLLPTGNPGSFVSVKVSVSSSVGESPGTTESVEFSAPTEEPVSATTHLPAVDALFTMWSHDPEPTTVSPTEAGDEFVEQESETTEADEVTNTEELLPSPAETTTSFTPTDTDSNVFVVKASTFAPEVEITAAPVGEADVADQALGPPQEASLVHVLHKTTPPEPKPTLYDSQSLLAFSTVTPRYRDPDSLFKRKTYLRSGGSHQSSVTWMVGVCSLLLLWSRWQ